MILNEDRKDCLQEVINVAMGQASDKLARYLDTFVHLQVPNIDLVDAEFVPNMFTEKYGDDSVYVVSQGFYGQGGIRGEALLVYRSENAEDITSLLGYEDDDVVSHVEQLTDLSSILTTTFLNSWAMQLDNSLAYNAPRVVSSEHTSICTQLQKLSFNWEVALKVDIAYLVTDRSFNCDMVLLIPGEAVDNISIVLDKILEEF